MLASRESELIVLLTELIDYGIIVFNREEENSNDGWKTKFVPWGHSPESLLDTATGIDEVNYCLNRIEFGNFA